MSATKLSLITLPFITGITICFLLLSSVQSISLPHNMHYNNFVYAMAGKHYTITIPKGSANPEVDITKLGPRQWYMPRTMTISVNDNVTWINQDTEAHTVTSGTGGGMESLVNVNKKGSPTGDFNSGLFKPGQSWTRTFTKPGMYNYFCTIHPWMEGIINVKAQAQNIPNYPVTDTGKRIDKLPVYTFTTDGKFEVGLSWNPKVLLTGKETTFFISFFDRANNKPNLLSFDFVLFQNGMQLKRIPTSAQIGMNVQNYVFANSGPVNIRIENIGGTKTDFAAFNTTVYNNPSISSSSASQLALQYEKSNQQSSLFQINLVTLVSIVYAVIIGIPAAVAVIYILYRKGII
ncbi:MAG TPA: plastocyanin/azurin family copper-binding protein [Nitrososphaeraceae archaeon]